MNKRMIGTLKKYVKMLRISKRSSATIPGHDAVALQTCSYSDQPSSTWEPSRPYPEIMGTWEPLGLSLVLFGMPHNVGN